MQCDDLRRMLVHWRSNAHAPWPWLGQGQRIQVQQHQIVYSVRSRVCSSVAASTAPRSARALRPVGVLAASNVRGRRCREQACGGRARIPFGLPLSACRLPRREILRGLVSTGQGRRHRVHLHRGDCRRRIRGHRGRCPGRRLVGTGALLSSEASRLALLVRELLLRGLGRGGSAAGRCRVRPLGGRRWCYRLRDLGRPCWGDGRNRAGLGGSLVRRRRQAGVGQRTG